MGGRRWRHERAKHRQGHGAADETPLQQDAAAEAPRCKRVALVLVEQPGAEQLAQSQPEHRVVRAGVHAPKLMNDLIRRRFAVARLPDQHRDAIEMVHLM
jgi:hypothetical protein